MLSDDELTQKLLSLEKLTDGIYGASLITYDGFVLKNAFPPSVDLDRIWSIAAPYLNRDGSQVETPDAILLIEPGPDATLLVLVHPGTNVALIRVAMQRLSRALAEPIATMLRM